MVTKNSADNNTRPRVSVIIPYFNREDFLAEAVESVLSQTEKNWELLLVDDGSTDRSREIAETFAASYPSKIRLLNHKNGENKGASAARHLGITEAIGEYVAFLDSDDVLFEDALDRELDAFLSHPEADVVCGTLICWYSWSEDAENWEVDFTVDLVLALEKMYRPPDLFVHNLGTGGSKPGINCVMLKREFAREFDVFGEDYKYAWEDQVFWAKVTLNAKIFVMDAVLAKYRQHPASTCAIESGSGRDFTSMNIFLNWLESYVRENEINDRSVLGAVKGFRRRIMIENRLKGLKQLYRKTFSLKRRYAIRDQLTRIRKIWPVDSHRDK